MKKTILTTVAALAIILGTSCNKEAKNAESKTEKKEVVTTTKTEKKETTEATNGVPSFSDKAVQDYVNAYEAYVEDYKKAAEKKDMTAFAALGQKGQELGTKAQEINGNLSTDDAKKLGDYMMKKSKEIQAYSEKMMN